MLVMLLDAIYNARCDTDETGARSRSEIQEKKEMYEKNHFWLRHVNVTKRANFSRRMIELRVYFDMKQTFRGFLS